ncbi:MAG: RNA polymerase sigma factor [Planctomycetota bacterium]|nr:MAG: RNA polymerase sigma factor [Planctomycetota bacterium]
MDESLAPNLGLEDLRWLHGLARRLVEDPNEADDAVQDTVLAALTRAPKSVTSPRGWLGTVLRNVVRQGRRRAARRVARERERDARDETRSTAEVVEELAWHRTLVERVNALAEPYRTTIVLRFLRGCGPRGIAREQGVPVKTVHTRIERGLAHLCVALDRGHGGDRHAWVVGLMPLARSKGGAIGLLSGAALFPMNLKLVTAGAAVLEDGEVVRRVEVVLPLRGVHEVEP